MRLFRLPCIFYKSENAELEDIGVEVEEEEKEGEIVFDLDEVEAYWDYGENSVKVIARSGTSYVFEVSHKTFDSYFTPEIMNILAKRKDYNV